MNIKKHRRFAPDWQIIHFAFTITRVLAVTKPRNNFGRAMDSLGISIDPSASIDQCIEAAMVLPVRVAQASFWSGAQTARHTALRIFAQNHKPSDRKDHLKWASVQLNEESTQLSGRIDALLQSLAENGYARSAALKALERGGHTATSISSFAYRDGPLIGATDGNINNAAYLLSVDTQVRVFFWNGWEDLSNRYAGAIGDEYQYEDAPKCEDIVRQVLNQDRMPLFPYSPYWMGPHCVSDEQCKAEEVQAFQSLMATYANAHQALGALLDMGVPPEKLLESCYRFDYRSLTAGNVAQQSQAPDVINGGVAHSR